MKKILHTIIKVVFSLLIFMPVLGTLGVFPAPTADMYSNPQAFEFIKILMNTQYIMVMMAVVHIMAIIAVWTKREVLASMLELPIVLNIIGFHMFLDQGLLTMSAMMGNILFLIVVYFIWKNKDQYKKFLCNK